MTERPHTDHTEYTAALAETLDMRDVPADAVAQIVREVESHLAESGEDPVEAFGPAARYADQFAPRSRERGLLALAVSAGLLGFCGAFLIIGGVFGLLDDSAQLWGLPPWARLAGGGAFVATFVVMVVVLAVRSRRRAAAWRLGAPGA